MTLNRMTLLALVGAALAAAGCSAGRTAPAPGAPGVLEARLATPPAGVQAVLITVTGDGIDAPMRARLTADQEGHWSGRVVNVPPGVNRTVTAYAYDTLTVPEDPVADTTGLVYRGTKTNVAVTSGQLTSVLVPLLPWPDGGGGVGLNTPPHVASVVHPTSITIGATTTFTATALDPDSGATLTYLWSDDVGGSFSGGDQEQPARFSNEEPGEAIPAGWTAPAGFIGTATITLSVSDGQATATTSFPVAVGSGLDVSLVFDVLPTITILPGASQSLVPGEQTTIRWQLAYPEGAGPDAPGSLYVQAIWSDSCGGTFSPTYDGDPWVYRFEPSPEEAVTYTAPASAPDAPGRCDLKLTLTSPYGASVWSGLIAWVNPTITGSWTGTVTDAVTGEATATLALAQAGDTVAGTWSTSLGSTGSVSGTTDGLTMDFAVEVLDAGCPGTLTGTGTVGEGGLMAISYTGSTTCGGDTTGGGTLARGSGWNGKVVFVTRVTFTGDLGGLAGADANCQVLADEGASEGALPVGTWRAFLSTTGVDAASRLPDARWVLPDGTLIAEDTATLLGGWVLPYHPIDQDEFGSPVDYGNPVWTGSHYSGHLWEPAATCADWTSSGAVTGVVGQVNGTWTSAGLSDCNQLRSLYCFQQ